MFGRRDLQDFGIGKFIYRVCSKHGKYELFARRLGRKPGPWSSSHQSALAASPAWQLTPKISWLRETNNEIKYINRAEDHLDDGIYKIYFQLRGVSFSPFLLSTASIIPRQLR